MNRLTYNMPLHKLLGWRLNDWRFLAVLAFPCIAKDVGEVRMQILKNTGRFQWFKPQFGFRIFDVRP